MIFWSNGIERRSSPGHVPELERLGAATTSAATATASRHRRRIRPARPARRLPLRSAPGKSDVSNLTCLPSNGPLCSDSRDVRRVLEDPAPKWVITTSARAARRLRDDRRMTPQLERGKGGRSGHRRELFGRARNFRFKKHSRPLPFVASTGSRKVLTGILEAASLGRIRFRLLTDRSSKYFEQLDLMMMGGPVPPVLRPPKRSGAVTKTGRPTLETVATAAGVSLATVSKVLNDRADVSAATRARVQRLLVQYKYVPPGRPHGQPVRRGPPVDRPGLHCPGQPVLRRDPARGHVEPHGCRGVVDAGPLRLASVVQWTRLGRTVRGHHRRFRTDPVGSTHPGRRSRSVRVDRSGRPVARAERRHRGRDELGRRALGGAASARARSPADRRDRWTGRDAVQPRPHRRVPRRAGVRGHRGRPGSDP